MTFSAAPAPRCAGRARQPRLRGGKKVAEGRIERTTPTRFSLDECFDVGEDTGTPVAEDYAERMPFRFTGELRKLTVYLK